jgi:dihydroxyacetone kinase
VTAVPARPNDQELSMKKLVNNPADIVVRALRGMAAAHPELRVDLGHRILYRGDAPVRGKVALVSGGGSGHEPMHGGFAGPGMLDAACAGEAFTSPVPDQLLEATRNVDAGALGRWLRELARRVNEQKDLLTELDSAIGDADHGLSLDRGLDGVAARGKAVVGAESAVFAPTRTSCRSERTT